MRLAERAPQNQNVSSVFPYSVNFFVFPSASMLMLINWLHMRLREGCHNKNTQYDLRSLQHWVSQYPGLYLNFVSRPKMMFINSSLEDRRCRSTANAMCCIQVYFYWFLLDSENEFIIWVLSSSIFQRKTLKDSISEILDVQNLIRYLTLFQKQLPNSKGKRM